MFLMLSIIIVRGEKLKLEKTGISCLWIRSLRTCARHKPDDISYKHHVLSSDADTKYLFVAWTVTARTWKDITRYNRTSTVLQVIDIVCEYSLSFSVLSLPLQSDLSMYVYRHSSHPRNSPRYGLSAECQNTKIRRTVMHIIMIKHSRETANDKWCDKQKLRMKCIKVNI